MKRGIIASSGKAERIDKEGVSFKGILNKEDLNYYTLYFDEIVIPTNNIIHFGLPQENELISLNILKRPQIQISQWTSIQGEGSFDIFLESQLIIAKKLISEKSDTDWTLHQIGDSTIIMDGYNKDFNSIKVRLQECLPVPTENVSFEQILNFKLKRNDELLALHTSIDELYIEILKSPDSNFSSKKCISELNLSIQNLEKSSNETFKHLNKYDLTTELNINAKDIALALGGGVVFDFYTNGLTIPIATIIAGLGSLINIKASNSRSFEPAENKLKLSYLANAKKSELIK
jgi:hypothetical protein